MKKLVLGAVICVFSVGLPTMSLAKGIKGPVTNPVIIIRPGSNPVTNPMIIVRPA